MTGTAIGATVGALFGGAWAIAGASALRRELRVILSTAAVLISVMLVVAVMRLAPAGSGTFHGGIYGAAVAFEVIAILGTAVALMRRGQRGLLPPAIGFIVGLHFIGLWLATTDPLFGWLALSLCAVAVAGALVCERARLPVTGLGSALCLWASTVLTLL